MSAKILRQGEQENVAGSTGMAGTFWQEFLLQL
jgi:hypothetical protein